MLYQKKILLGISGGIAAYKCAHLVRLLIKEGAEVKVVMTASACEFITPQTLSVLSKNKVNIHFFDADHNWINHVHLAEWADIFLIAPLTANTLSKLVHGGCDNLLLTTFFSYKGPSYAAPAMDLEMYQNSVTVNNLNQLAKNGTFIIPAEEGELASGLNGVGRMSEPENIVSFLKTSIQKSLPYYKKKVLINAGPTYEAIDPVRFIGNRSSGKMGIALANCFYSLGADVTLVLGPANSSGLNKNIRLENVESAEQMFNATKKHFEQCDIAICSAAVADYKPETVSEQKIKKKDQNINLNLVKTDDILAELGRSKKDQIVVGFALETEDLENYAQKKLQNKNLDIIIANSASEQGSGFAVDTNKVTVIDKHNKITKFELKHKSAVAKDIADYILQFKK